MIVVVIVVVVVAVVAVVSVVCGFIVLCSNKNSETGLFGCAGEALVSNMQLTTTTATTTATRISPRTRMRT